MLRHTPVKAMIATQETSTRTMGRAILALFIGLALTACVEDAVTSPQGGTISGTVYYAGPAAAPGRPLAIALYSSYPPVGPPAATRLVDSYQFPYDYHFENLAPGTYYVGALIDVDRLDTRHTGMLNAGRDPYAYAPGPVIVDDLEGASGVDLGLEDAR